MIRKDFTVIGCIYCISTAICISNIYLNLFQIDYFLIMNIAALTCGIYPVIIIIKELTTSKYSIFLQIVIILLLSRSLGLCGTLLSIHLTSKELFLLPFGNIGNFIFNLTAVGLFRFLHQGNDRKKTPSFSSLYILPLFFLVIPYVIDKLFHYESLVLTIYSYLYTVVTALIVLFCLIAVKRNREYAPLAGPIIAACILDMLVYLYFTPISDYLPGGITYILIPFYTIFIANAALKIERREPA